MNRTISCLIISVRTDGCLSVYIRKMSKIGIGEILSSDSSALDAFIERKLKEAGHSLGDENKTAVVVNPTDNYVIKENERAVVIQ